MMGGKKKKKKKKQAIVSHLFFIHSAVCDISGCEKELRSQVFYSVSAFDPTGLFMLFFILFLKTNNKNN